MRKDVYFMQTGKNTVIILGANTLTGAYFVYNESGDIAILMDDRDYVCTIYNCNRDQLKDIVRFLEWDPDYPDPYLSRKYGIEDPDIFGGVMRYQEWFDVLYELSVIDSNVEVDFSMDLAEAFHDMFSII
jgi:hypothetical protein